MLISKLRFENQPFYSCMLSMNIGYLGNTEKLMRIDLNSPIFFIGTEHIGFELVEKLFQGQLVLRTRCLECESLTERREDFQDISVPVQEDELSKVEESSESKHNWGFSKDRGIITVFFNKDHNY